VLVTGAWNAEQILAGVRLHADGFVSKSSDFCKLTEALDNLALDVLLGGPSGNAARHGATQGRGQLSRQFDVKT
jgi:DNA-binding NarL/FixJ family response regulator